MLRGGLCKAEVSGLFGARSAGADPPLSGVWLGDLTFSSTSVAAYCASAGLRSLRNAHT